MLNFKILSNPLNWVIVWVILFGGALAFHLVSVQIETTASAGTA